ncbi:BRcat and Rcat domain-containing protein [Aspergillus udagawae]|uniref:RBR-type E3 ubiquitin transferase n=1 Tax=Aspergillus udagawae TaxID=91492 RepID=A0A8E0QP25_9EURO|nr:uncharacterized protein Aud_005233 [Aspergillus udagawae]GIC88832.1 hypothetical protein Aud_005233 [Aspergillus udagawae]
MRLWYSREMQRSQDELGFIASPKHGGLSRSSPEDRQTRDALVSPCSPTCIENAFDFAGSNDSPVISPLSPNDHARDHFLARRRRDDRLSLPGGGTPSSFQSIIRWDTDDEINCWSDAATAGAVLSLLHKEPPSPPPCPQPRFDRNASDEQRLTCVVCFDDLENGCYPQPPIAAGCDHGFVPGMHICFTCLRRSLDKQLSSGATFLSCPICLEKLSDEEVQRWSSRRTFQAYDTKRTWQILEEDAEFVPCVRKDCGYGQLHAGGLEDPIVVCGSCGTRTCFIHRDTVWHEGLSCEEYDRLLNPRRASPEIRMDAGREARRLFPGLNRLRTPRREAESDPRLGYSSGRPRGRLDPTNEELSGSRTIHELSKPCPNCKAQMERAGGCKFMRCKHSVSQSGIYVG